MGNARMPSNMSDESLDITVLLTSIVRCLLNREHSQQLISTTKLLALHLRSKKTSSEILPKSSIRGGLIKTPEPA